MTQDQPYSQQTEVALLKANQNAVQQSLTKMEDKLDRVLVELSTIRTLENKQANHAEALGRAFERIETVEKQSNETTRSLLEFMAQIRGMTKLAVALWTVLGGAVGWLLSKMLNP